MSVCLHAQNIYVDILTLRRSCFLVLHIHICFLANISTVVAFFFVAFIGQQQKQRQTEARETGA